MARRDRRVTRGTHGGDGTKAYLVLEPVLPVPGA